jgi:ornithine cyclodeaminase
MRLLFLSASDVARLLPMRECMTAVAGALEALARGDGINPLRDITWLPGGAGALGTMPAYLEGAMGAKVISVFPGNHDVGLESHYGVVVLFETERGLPLAVVDASSVTAIRTAAASGVATRALAREAASELALLGSGVQAASHLEAMLVARAVERVRVWSPNEDRARAFAEREGERHGVPVAVAATAEDAVRGADVVCTVTSAREPVLRGEWLSPGAHVNAVGACSPPARELDAAAVARSRFFVDRRESALAEAGDFLLAREEGAVTDDHIRGELGDVLAGRVAGRTSEADVTVFESLGIGVEDVASARYLYDEATRAGAGAWVDL